MIIQFTQEAADGLKKICLRIKAKWGLKTSLRLENAVFDTLELISLFPESYPKLKEYPELRKCVVLGKTILLYQILPEKLLVWGIYDARQNYEEELFEGE